MTTPTTHTTAPTGTSGVAMGRADTDRDVHHVRPLGDETKPSWKSTELWVYLAAVLGVLLASQMVGDGAGDNGGDYFAADKAWWFITLLTIGYLVSRGLAKSGTRTRDTDPRTSR